MEGAGSPKFLVDQNVGRLARWLRLMGYDAAFFTGSGDSELVARALKEDRVILTRDSRIGKRRLVKSGRLRIVFFESDNPQEQIYCVMTDMNLRSHFKPFTLCLECNQPLEKREKQQLQDRLPLYVYKTQEQFMECPTCRRLYWRGTHWRAMKRWLDELVGC
jgi:uncharacterized protein with PIN domain